MEHNPTFTIEGSSSLVVQLFECGLNSILYLRGLYPPQDFETTTIYGVKMIMSINPELKTYIKNITEQLQVWVKRGAVRKIETVISSKATKEVLERWLFDIEIIEENSVPMSQNVFHTSKIKAQAVKQFRAFLRQIASSVADLPILEEEDCTFNILVYADKNLDIKIFGAIVIQD